MAITTSFIGELRRRNVIRAALLYVGAVWALAQGIASLGPAVGMPDWATRWFLVAAAIGLPFWLAFAWFFEFTPDGLKRESQIDAADSIAHRTGRKLDFAIIVVLAVAVVLLLTDRFVLHHGVNEEAAIVAPDHSIAVLPFVNMSDEKANEYFSDGISEELLNLLAKIPQLQVTARTSSFSFKGKEVAIPEIARALHVAYVLEGSVRKSGHSVRITAELIRASTDTHLWSQTYDRKLDDIFAIQDDIAGDVVKQLKVSLLSGAPKARAVNPEAYALYLQARQLGRQSTATGYDQSIALLQRALMLQPNYVAALDALAADYLNQANARLRPTEEAMRLTREVSNRALTHDPDYAPAYARLGSMALQYDLDLASAAVYLERAMRLAPTDPIVSNAAALLANSLARPKLAIPLIDQVLASDPLNPAMQANAGLVYLFARQPEESLAHFRAAAQLSPSGIGHEFAVGLGLLQKGDSAGALAEVRTETNERMRLAGLTIVYHALGRGAESDEAMSQLVQKYGVDAAYQIATAAAWRNEPDRVFEWLEKAATAHDPRLNRLGADPHFDKLHGDPRWLPFLSRFGMAPEQLAAIKFDVKLPQ